jgi:hypothetical protein
MAVSKLRGDQSLWIVADESPGAQRLKRFLDGTTIFSRSRF